MSGFNTQYQLEEDSSPSAAPSENPTPLFFRLGHRAELTGLRAIAVGAVLLLHSRPQYLKGGGIGVDIFFALSGFLITSLLVNEFAKKQTISFGKFYLRRFLRLAPAFLFLGAVLATYLYFNPKTNQTYKGLGIALLYVSNWFRAFGNTDMGHLEHTWSLAIEEQFYIVWPILLFITLKLTSLRGAFYASLAGIATSTIARALILSANVRDTQRIYNGLDTRADALLYGCALALGLMSGIIEYSKIRGYIIRALSVVACAWFAYFAYFGKQKGYWLSLYPYTVAGVASAVLLLHLIWNPKSILGFITRNKILVWLGTLSYSLYLWHYPVFRIVRETAGIQYIMPYGFILAVLCAAVSYYFVEKPFLRLKDRISSRGH